MNTQELVQQLIEANLPVDCLSITEAGDAITLVHPEGRSQEDRDAAQAIADTWFASESAKQQYAALCSQHAAEEAAGVTLSNGWRMGYSQTQRSNYAEIKAAIDMIGSARTWRLWDADGVEHADLTAEQAMAVITEYTLLVAAQRERQFGELAALWG